MNPLYVLICFYERLAKQRKTLPCCGLFYDCAISSDHFRRELMLRILCGPDHERSRREFFQFLVPPLKGKCKDDFLAREQPRCTPHSRCQVRVSRDQHDGIACIGMKLLEHRFFFAAFLFLTFFHRNLMPCTGQARLTHIWLNARVGQTTRKASGRAGPMLMWMKDESPKHSSRYADRNR